MYGSTKIAVMDTPKQRHPIHTFDIDNYLNHYIPQSRFDLLPSSISHWFGHRPLPKGVESKPAPPSTSIPLVWLFSFLGAFIGIAIIENVFLRLPRLDGVPVPIVIASFGAAAILEYNVIDSPLSQPRNLIVGHVLSATIGVGITKLFMLLPEERFTSLRWLAGALSVGIASSVMSMTKTVHPPAGATALLASTSPEVLELGWWLVVLILLAGVLMLVSAMLINNLYKKFPVYWWTPVDLKRLNDSKIMRPKDLEEAKVESESSSQISSDVGLKESAYRNTGRNGSNVPEVEHHEGPIDTTERQRRSIHDNPETKVEIELDRIIVPDWMQLSLWEAQVLEEFQNKLREQNRT